MLEMLKTPKKILLIEPPFYILFGYERFHYPITLTLIGTYYEEMGHTVKILDADKPDNQCKAYNRGEAGKNYHLYEKELNDQTHYIWKVIRDTIAGYSPDIIGITSITAKIESANIVAKMAKELLGDKTKVVLGGPHVDGIRSMFPDYNFGPDYDYIAGRIPNLVDRKPNKQLIINHESYSALNFSSIMTSTGCPNSCTFCCHSYEKSMVYRNIDSIRHEVEEIRDLYGCSNPIFIVDDCFFSNSKHFKDVGDILRENKMKFTSGARVMALSREKISQFAANGGQRIYIGVESGSQRILDKIKKRLRKDEIVKRTKWLNEANIPWSAFFITGFPFETLEDLKMTQDIIEEIQPTFISLNRFTPYPGTEIYKEYYRDSKFNFKDLFQLNQDSYVRLGDECEEYISKMFEFADKYNAEHANKKQLKK
ncbi:MAG: B12-binding domain-containing radical SAM protein [Bacillota bacterium]